MKQAKFAQTYPLKISMLDWLDLHSTGVQFEYSLKKVGSSDLKLHGNLRSDSIFLSWDWYGHNAGDVSQIIKLKRTSCHHGDSKTYFVCPHCGRRVGTLHIGKNSVYCSTCLEMIRHSAQEKKYTRAVSKSNALSGKLSPYGEQPKGMSDAEYERIANRILLLDDILFTEEQKLVQTYAMRLRKARNCC